MKIRPDLSYDIVEILTPCFVESSSFKRSKERSWTFNLAEEEEDAVLLFPTINIMEDIEGKGKSTDPSTFSWSNLFTFKG